MALLCSRIFSRNFKNRLSVVSRFYAEEKELPDPMELATGLEKWELTQAVAGNKDPFRMGAVKRHASSKSNPIKVPSYYDCRIIGCVCEEDSSEIVWMWLFKGEPRRCHCGHWFQLESYNSV